MRIFWVFRIYTQTGPQNTPKWPYKAKATCDIIFCDGQSNNKNIYAKFNEYKEKFLIWPPAKGNTS